MTSWKKENEGLDPKKEYRPREVFARDVGLEFEKLNLRNVIVKESPRKRDYGRLLKKYESRFVLDLHDAARDYNPVHYPNEIHYVAHIYHVPNSDLDEYFLKFQRENVKTKKAVQGHGYVNEVDPYGILLEHLNPRAVGIELFPWAGKEKTLKFLERFTNFLQHNDLDV